MGLCHATSTTVVSASQLPGEDAATQQPGVIPAPEEHVKQYDWQPDEEAELCQRCLQTRFSLLERRHHCRSCGRVVCGECSKRREVLQHKAVRVCNICAENLQNIRLPPDSQDNYSSDEEQGNEDEQLPVPHKENG